MSLLIKMQLPRQPLIGRLRTRRQRFVPLSKILPPSRPTFRSPLYSGVIVEAVGDCLVPLLVLPLPLISFNSRMDFLDLLHLQVEALSTHINDHHSSLSTCLDIQERDLCSLSFYVLLDLFFLLVIFHDKKEEIMRIASLF